MTQFGEVIHCHKPPYSGIPGEDFVNVRFATQDAADRAYAALKASQVFVDGFQVGVGPAPGGLQSTAGDARDTVVEMLAALTFGRLPSSSSSSASLAETKSSSSPSSFAAFKPCRPRRARRASGTVIATLAAASTTGALFCGTGRSASAALTPLFDHRGVGLLDSLEAPLVANAGLVRMLLPRQVAICLFDFILCRVGAVEAKDEVGVALLDELCDVLQLVSLSHKPHHVLFDGPVLGAQCLGFSQAVP